jgi:hypothetical protein
MIIGSMSGATASSERFIHPLLQAVHTARMVWSATTVAGHVFTVPARGPCWMLRSYVISAPTTAAGRTSLIQFGKVCSRVILMSAPVRPQKMHFVLSTVREVNSVTGVTRTD